MTLQWTTAYPSIAFGSFRSADPQPPLIGRIDGSANISNPVGCGLLSISSPSDPGPSSSSGQCSDGPTASMPAHYEGLEHSQTTPSPDGLQSVVDDIAFWFWKCQRCFSMAHVTAACTNRIKCRVCFRKGHISKSCTESAPAQKLRWVPKITPPSTIQLPAALDITNRPDASSSQNPNIPPAPSSTISLPPPTLPAKLLRPPDTQASMANFELDPKEYLPPGFNIIDDGLLCLPGTFYSLAVAPERCHKQFTIAIVEPEPLPEEVPFFRDLVSNYVVNHLHIPQV